MASVAEEGGECGLCFRGTLELVNGMLVCDVCGGIQQNFAEETQEYQAGLNDTQYRRSTRLTPSQREPVVVKEKEAADIDGAIRAYLSALQRMLVKQLDTLIQAFQVSPSVKDVARQIWEAHVLSSRILETSFIRALEAKVEAMTQHGHSTAPYHGTANSIQDAIERSFNLVMSYHSTLAICFLSCFYCREAVDPFDISSWALDGQLPYLTFAADTADLLNPYAKLFSRAFVNVRGVPSAPRIYMISLNMAEELSLQSPPLNSPLWLRRYLGDLRLPEEIYPVALLLLRTYQPCWEVADGRLTSTGSLHPWAAVMAFVVLSCKLACGLGVDNSPMLSEIQIGQTWLSWAANEMERLNGLSTHPLLNGEAIQSSRLLDYLQHLRRTVFTNKVPEGFEEYQAALDRLANNTPGAPSIAREPQEVFAKAGSPTHTGKENALAPIPKTARGRTTAAMTPTYAAVLTACSLRAWISPSILDEGVRQLEELVLEAESQVAYDNMDAAQELLDIRKKASPLSSE